MLFNSRDISVVATIWNEKSDSRNKQFEVFNGRGFLKKEDKDVFSYQLKSDKDELANDLLDIAPDIKQTAPSSDSVYFNVNSIENTYLDKRNFPMNLGLMKYVAMFALTVDGGSGSGEYYIDGSVYGLYDGGQSIRYAQHDPEYRVTQNDASSSPVYELSYDVDGADEVFKTDTVSTTPLPLNFNFVQSTEPLATKWTLLNGMTWTNTASLNKEYVWDTTITINEYGHNYWKEITDTRITDGLNDDGTVAKVVSGVNLPTTGMIAGLNITQDYMGYYDDLGMSWDSYMASNGHFYFGGNADNYISWEGTELTIGGIIKSSDFVDIPTATGFRLKSEALGTSADPTIFGAFISGSTVVGDDIIIASSSDNSFTGELFSIYSHKSFAPAFTSLNPSYLPPVILILTNTLLSRENGSGHSADRVTSDNSFFNVLVTGQPDSARYILIGVKNITTGVSKIITHQNIGSGACSFLITQATINSALAIGATDTFHLYIERVSNYSVNTSPLDNYPLATRYDLFDVSTFVTLYNK